METVSNPPFCEPIANRPLRTVSNKRMHSNTMSNVDSDENSASVRSAVAMNTLPRSVLSKIGAFTNSNSLSGASNATLAAAPEMSYKIDIRKTARQVSSWLLPENMATTGLQCGSLPTGRVIAHITITNCGREIQPWEDSVKLVVWRAIPTLKSVTIKSIPGIGSVRVAAILGRLTIIVAPNLTRVVIQGAGSAVKVAGQAIASGLWPALEVLEMRHCRGKASHFQELAHGLKTGRAPNLRVLNWDDQASNRTIPLDNLILSALAAGKCPRIERLSFTDNYRCPEARIDQLKCALRACPGLMELRMDCSSKARNEFRDLKALLEAGYIPHLTMLFVRSSHKPKTENGTLESAKALMQAGESRNPPVHVSVEIYRRVIERR